jgi:Zn-dependent M28 family amino/carboxypeptidase
MDNGSGSALLLDIARSLKQAHTTLKRSLLLVWVTGEEKGLLGSKYFAEHPTVTIKSMVAVPPLRGKRGPVTPTPKIWPAPG